MHPHVPAPTQRTVTSCRTTSLLSSFMALAPRLRALGSCVARTAASTSAAPAVFAAPAVLRALDSCVARTASNTSTAPEVFSSAAPAVFRGASLTGKSITQLKTHIETRCDTGFKPPGIRPPHTTHRPGAGVAGWHSKATRCPRRWYTTMIPSDLSIPSRQMELAEDARHSWARLVGEEDACGIPSSVDDETASNSAR